MRLRAIHALFIQVLFLVACIPALAHVHWTQVNQPDPYCIGLYHIGSASAESGQTINVAAGMPAARSLHIQTPAGLGFQIISDLPDGIFSPYSMKTQSAQIAQSTEVVEHLDGDLTIEFWLKWEMNLTSQSIRAGLASGAKLAIARNVLQPASDLFAIQFTHGDTVSAPGFASWAAVGSEEAPLGEWLHFAVTIHSTGIVAGMIGHHDVYDTGSTARFWLNGHAVGFSPFTVDIAGMQVHDDSAIRLENITGSVLLDEFALWSVDWSQDGVNSNPFANGRGAGYYSLSGIKEWASYR